MALIADHFIIEELVCKDVCDKFKERAWQFFDPRLIQTIDWIRERLNKPVYVNNWDNNGKYDERGLRCIQCSLVKDAIAQNRLYVSPHMLGQAIDFDVMGMVAEEVRQWLVKNKASLPHPIRLENGTTWVHLDVQNTGQKVYLFNP